MSTNGRALGETVRKGDYKKRHMLHIPCSPELWAQVQLKINNHKIATGRRIMLSRLVLDLLQLWLEDKVK